VTNKPKQPPFDKAWEIGAYLMPRIVDKLRIAHSEHGDSWRNGDEDDLRRNCKDESWSELTMLHVKRKLQAYKQGGECDLDQLIGAINYILLQAGRQLNNEAEKC